MVVVRGWGVLVWIVCTTTVGARLGQIVLPRWREEGRRVNGFVMGAANQLLRMLQARPWG